MKRLLMALGLLVSVSGCTAGDAITARQLTVVDGAQFVAENHERRREIRKKLYALEDELIAKCMDRARAEDITGTAEDAIGIADYCFAFIKRAYPDLATIELLREGLDNVDNLMERYPDLGLPPRPE